jgi:hypothetical protein
MSYPVNCCMIGMLSVWMDRSSYGSLCLRALSRALECNVPASAAFPGSLFIPSNSLLAGLEQRSSADGSLSEGVCKCACLSYKFDLKQQVRATKTCCSFLSMYLVRWSFLGLLGIFSKLIRVVCTWQALRCSCDAVPLAQAVLPSIFVHLPGSPKVPDDKGI